jgi:hypothetical protein
MYKLVIWTEHLLPSHWQCPKSVPTVMRHKEPQLGSHQFSQSDHSRKGSRGLLLDRRRATPQVDLVYHRMCPGCAHYIAPLIYSTVQKTHPYSGYKTGALSISATVPTLTSVGCIPYEAL